MPRTEARGTRRLPKNAGQFASRWALEIVLATAEMSLAANEANCLLEAIGKANAEGAGHLAVQVTWHDAGTAHPVYVEALASLKAGALTIAGHVLLQIRCT